MTNEANNVSLFKGVGESKPSRDRDYFRPGRYLAQVEKFLVKQNDDGLIHYIFEMCIVDVIDESEALKDADGPHGLGHGVSWVMGKHKKPSLPNLKAALMVMTGVPEESITEQFCADLTSSSQPLAGIFIEFLNKPIVTKAGAPFTVIKAKRKWSHKEVFEKVGPEQLLNLGVELELGSGGE